MELLEVRRGTERASCCGGTGTKRSSRSILAPHEQSVDRATIVGAAGGQVGYHDHAMTNRPT